MNFGWECKKLELKAQRPMCIGLCSRPSFQDREAMVQSGQISEFDFIPIMPFDCEKCEDNPRQKTVTVIKGKERERNPDWAIYLGKELEASGLSERELAKQIGIARMTLRNVLHYRRIPTKRTAVVIKAYLIHRYPEVKGKL